MPSRDDFPAATGAPAELAHGESTGGYQEGNLLKTATANLTPNQQATF